MRGSGSAESLRRGMLTARKRQAVQVLDASGHGRAVDRLSDVQLMTAELLVWHGLTAERAAQRLNVDVATVRAWFREPLFIAGCNELVRAYCAGQLVPMALTRVRMLLASPVLSLRDAVHAGRFVAELAGLYRTGAPEAGTFAPGPLVSGRSVAEMSAEELQAVAVRGAQALARLSMESEPDPLA